MLGEAFFIPKAKSQKRSKKLLTFPDFCANIQSQGQRKSKSKDKNSTDKKEVMI